MESNGEWQEVLLGDIATEVTVGYVGSMTGEYVPYGIAFLRSQNIEPYHLNLDGLIYINEAFHKKLKKSALKPGDVVVVRTGTPGTAVVIPETLPEANCSDLVIIRPGENLDPRFLAYYINAVAHLQVSANLVGAVQQHFNVGAAKNLKIQLPPIKEQKVISQIIGYLDNKIEFNRRMNHTLEGMAAAIFKSWFVDFDPVVAKSEGRQPFGIGTEIAELFPEKFEETGNEFFSFIPKDWKLNSLDQIAHYENGLALQKYRPESKDYLPVIKIRELRQGYADGNSEKASPNIKQSCIIDDGDIVFSWSGSLMIDFWCGGKGALNQHLFKVTSDKYPMWLVYFWTNYHLTDFQEIAQGKAVTMGHIQRHHLSSAMVVIPPYPILQNADHLIRPLVDKIILNRIQSRTLAIIRDLLLPELLSGEIRLKHVEKLTSTS